MARSRATVVLLYRGDELGAAQIVIADGWLDRTPREVVVELGRRRRTLAVALLALQVSLNTPDSPASLVAFVRDLLTTTP